MKKIIFLIIIILFGRLAAEDIARIGDFIISSEELMKEMENYEGKYSQAQIRQKAKRALIQKYILRNYAEERNITITDQEVDDFFIEQLGDHERFQNEGSFDRNKFELFKLTKKGRNILEEMRSELLFSKIRTIIDRELALSEDELFQRYFSENTKMDLSYAIIEVEDANVPINISFNDAFEFYQQNQQKYLFVEGLQFEFFLVFHREFSETVEPLVNSKIRQITEKDSTLSAIEIENLKNKIKKEETAKYCREKAAKLRQVWIDKKKLSYPIIKTSYLPDNVELGQLPSKIISFVKQLKIGEYSPPLDFGQGFIVLHLLDKKKIKRENEELAKNQAWKDFISKKENINPQYTNYFTENIEEFIIPVAVVQKIEIDHGQLFSNITAEEYQKKIKAELRACNYQDQELKKIIQKYKLKSSDQVIYLEKFTNKNPLDEKIAQNINDSKFFGFLEDKKKLVYYQMNSFFSDYIPDLKDIKSQLYRFVETAKVDSIDYEQYYLDHKKDFMTADSLQLAGALFQLEDQNPQIKMDSIFTINQQKYQANISRYYREHSTEFDHIFVKDRQLAEIIVEQAKAKIDFDLLDFCFGNSIKLPEKQIIQYEELPTVIKNSLLSLKKNQISKPLKYENGWLILRKLNEFSAGIIPYNELKIKMFQETLQDKKRAMAKLKAKAVFDSTRRYYQLKKFATTSNIFQTKLHPAEAEFEFIGKLGENLPDLIRLWNGEKYSQILETENGFAVIFVLQKVRSKQLSFPEALPRIKEKIKANQRFERAKEFVSRLRQKIRSDRFYKNQLSFLGGWQHSKNLKLNDNIPGIKFSSIILEDAIKREKGYLSPVIPIDQKKMMFYRIDELERPSYDEFLQERERYERSIHSLLFQKWLQKYKTKLEIEIY